MRYIFLILILSVVFICCKKKNTQIENINGSVENINGSEYFPNTVGDYWKYKYVDSLNNNSTSFVDVNIVGNKLLSNGQNAKVWVFNFTDHVDTNYVYQISDTIRFLNLYLNIVNTYVIPLSLNNKWENSFLFDSIQVKEQRIFILNKKNFDNSFLLSERGYSFNYSLTRVEWFCPNIGMLTKTRKEYNLGYVDDSYWELVEYQLK
jgi:hypothetical protein